MEPLTQEEVQKFNGIVATWGPDERNNKDASLLAFKNGGDEWISYVRAVISQN